MALRNSLLKTGMFNNEKTAEEQVVGVLNFNIHLVKDFKGRRYIERVTECIPVEDKNDYTFEYKKENTLEGKIDKFMDNATKYFTKVTNKELYKYVNILEYRDGEYVITNKISNANLLEMRNNMDEADTENFLKFIERHWGAKTVKEIKID
jgi:pilus assembly protein CpaF